MNNLRLGDKVKLIMPSGAISEIGIATRVDIKAKKCTVYWEDTGTFFTVDFENLLPPF